MTNFDLNVTEVKVTPTGYKSIEINFDADSNDVMSLISIEEFIKYFGSQDILNEIGVDEVKEHFELIEKED